VTPRQHPDPLSSLLELLDELPEGTARQAFTHASWVERRADSYERLAFLGDVVLSLAISTHLFPLMDDVGAGRLTKVRAQAVSQQACAEVARDLGVPPSVCESVIGAAYLTWGIERVAPAVVDAFATQIEDAIDNPIDFKSHLQERLARRSQIVTYRIDMEEGPPHERSFVAVAEVEGEEMGRGEGRSKKSAEQEAAARALDTLEAGR
jgi:ribonuclease-3